MQLAASDRVLHLWTRGAAIGEEVCPALRVELGLVMHVLTAARQDRQANQTGEYRRLRSFVHHALHSLLLNPRCQSQWSTSTTETAL